MAKRFFRVAKSFILFLLTGAAGLILAACYGVPSRLTRMSVRTLTPAGSPIPGIKVGGDIAVAEARTDAEGRTSFDAYTIGGSAYLSFADTDGEENLGSFAETGELVQAPGGDITLEALP